MRKFIFLFSLILFILSCSSQRKVMDSWLGSNKQQLIMSWGPPARTASDGSNGEILVYANQVYLPQYNINNYNYKMFYVDGSGKIYHWLTRTERIPPTQIDLNIYRRY